MRIALLRRARMILVAPAVVSALCLLSIAASGCGSTATATAQATPGTQETAGTQVGSTTSATFRAGGDGLFDSSVVHEVTVTFAPEDYDAMIQAYQETGEKQWIEATVTIDGETYEHVGIRLKGNSSIMGLRGRGRTAAFNADTDDAINGDANTGAADTGPRQGFPAPMGGFGGNVSTSSPEKLPWLIDLDQFVDNQNHEGVVELVVRSNNTATALNEAVSLELLRQAGLASQEAAYVGFSVNGSETALRLVVENPDDLWMAANFDISGALYKAESTGDYSYRGDDPASYDEVFDQEAGKRNADLTPLIEFLDFINNADDATFNAELPGRLDIDAFATYLAMQDVLANQDDIDGPGNNSYLYYDTKAQKFTVVAWDHNLAFGSIGGPGGFPGGGFPGGGFPGGAQGGAVLDGGQAVPPEGFQQPDDAQSPEGMQAPEGFQPPTNTQGRTERRGGFGGRSNVLVERFKANHDWQQLYDERLAELRSELYGSGTAAAILEELATVLKTQASDLVDAATVDQEAANISRYFTTE